MHRSEICQMITRSTQRGSGKHHVFHRIDHAPSFSVK